MQWYVGCSILLYEFKSHRKWWLIVEAADNLYLSTRKEELLNFPHLLLFFKDIRGSTWLISSWSTSLIIRRLFTYPQKEAVKMSDKLGWLSVLIQCPSTRPELLLVSQGVAGQGAHGLWQRFPRTGSRNGWPASSPVSSSSYNYFTFAGHRQVCQYLRNKYLRQKFLLLQFLSFLSLFHGPQSDTVEYKVLSMEAL